MNEGSFFKTNSSLNLSKVLFFGDQQYAPLYLQDFPGSDM